MTDPIDIVAELRAFLYGIDPARQDTEREVERADTLMRDAADEIERLRGERLRRDAVAYREAMNYATKEDHR